jgi:hypothetical protein
MEKEEQQFIDAFVENSVSLQKALADAVVSMTRLTKEIEELIGLFKESAKTVEESKDTEILAKLDSIADENKTIAKSLTLTMESKPRPLPEYKF